MSRPPLSRLSSSSSSSSTSSTRAVRVEKATFNFMVARREFLATLDDELVPASRLPSPESEQRILKMAQVLEANPSQGTMIHWVMADVRGFAPGASRWRADDKTDKRTTENDTLGFATYEEEEEARIKAGASDTKAAYPWVPPWRQPTKTTRDEEALRPGKRRRISPNPIGTPASGTATPPRTASRTLTPGEGIRPQPPEEPVVNIEEEDDHGPSDADAVNELLQPSFSSYRIQTSTPQRPVSRVASPPSDHDVSFPTFTSPAPRTTEPTPPDRTDDPTPKQTLSQISATSSSVRYSDLPTLTMLLQQSAEKKKLSRTKSGSSRTALAKRSSNATATTSKTIAAASSSLAARTVSSPALGDRPHVEAVPRTYSYSSMSPPSSPVSERPTRRDNDEQDNNEDAVSHPNPPSGPLRFKSFAPSQPRRMAKKTAIKPQSSSSSLAGHGIYQSQFDVDGAMDNIGDMLNEDVWD